MDGSLDTSFDGDGIVTTSFPGSSQDQGGSVAIQADGNKIVVSGSSQVGSFNEFAVARFNENGSLDTSFSGDGMVTTSIGTGDDFAQDMVLHADDKIVVVGTSFNGSNVDFAVVRYNIDGTLDTSFSGDGKQTTAFGSGEEEAYGVAVQEGGKIVVSGWSDNGTNSDFAVARYNLDGSLDTTFSGDGKVTTPIGSSNDTGWGIAVQPSGKIVVAGRSANGANTDLALVRYNVDGSLDTSFDGDGKLTTDFGSTNDIGFRVATAPDGKIVVAGMSLIGTQYDIAVARYTAISASGVFNASGGSATLKNSIISGNFPTIGGIDVAGTFNSGGYNLIGNVGNAAGLTNGVNGDQVGTKTAPIDAKLGPLADNGGPTWTHALLPGSPAIEGGDPDAVAGENGVPDFDQRGAAISNTYI